MLSKMKYKIAVITFCYNEIDFCKFAIDYWKLFANHVYIFDDNSTDGCLDEFNKYKDWITVINKNHLTNNEINDYVLIDIKNQFWKTIKNCYDYVVICDLDECLYCQDWNNTLTLLNQYNINAIIPETHNLISLNLPEYEENKLIHNIIKDEENLEPKTRQHYYKKTMIFKCNNIYEINYAPGAHRCSPLALMNNTIQCIASVEINVIKNFHLQNVSLTRKINRHIEYGKRLSKINIENKLALEYKNDVETITKEFNEKWNNRLSF